jgi:DNA-binding transcriptional LysR family regulator
MKPNNKLITGANFKDLDWNKTKIFCHLAKCGGFTKAAKAAGISQSALTRQIRILEEQVGCPLVIRKPGGISLTRKGEELLEMIAPVFLQMKGFCGHNYVEVRGEKKRQIRIVTSHAVASYVINDLILEYNKDNPHLIFEIIGEDHEVDIILNDADIAIRPYDPKTEGIHQEHIFNLQRKLYASEIYLKMYGEPTSLEDLNNHYFLSYPISAEPSSSIEYPYSDVTWVLKVGMPKGKLRKPIFTSNSIECLVAAAKNNIGIMSGYEQMGIFRNSGLKIILPNTSRDEIKAYFLYPDYLKEDLEIIKIKTYLKEKLTVSV